MNRLSPYEILGVPANASDNEIKAAYRQKARDISVGTDQSSPFAEQRLDELNRAYDTILAMRRNSSSYTSDQNPFNEYKDYVQTYIDLRKKFRDGNYDDVDVILDTIPECDRSGEWYYLKAQVQYKKGWLTDAAENASKACSIDPTNSEYRDLYNRMQRNQAGGYRTQGKNKSSCCELCAAVSCIDCLCEAFGHDFIKCC